MSVYSTTSEVFDLRLNADDMNNPHFVLVIKTQIETEQHIQMLRDSCEYLLDMLAHERDLATLAAVSAALRKGEL